MHDYDWQKDVGFSTLELIMTAPMVVANWINMQYYGSMVDTLRFGSGNKVLHNVVGGSIGVLEGNGGDLRVGFALQSLHDGNRWIHEPVRLNVLIEAPQAEIDSIISRHVLVRELVDNGWLHLFQIDREALLAAEYSNKYREAQYQQWPYIREGVQAVDFLLCEAYISLHALRPSLTAIQFVRDTDGILLGFIGADFALRDLPQAGEIYEEPRHSRRFEGDPFISDMADTKIRSESKMDRHLDTVLSVVEELILVHGVYHIILHFSSSQAILWVMDDPYRYRLLTIDELIDPNICLAYPKRSYPDEAVVPQQEVRKILSNLRTLRFMQGIFYLRSGSVNIFNGTVGLTFSSDCSHYVSHDDFLKRDHTLWNNG
ncbi:DUF2309 domain-containing protein [Acidithiobacillus ferrooxidans]|uniref:DUF2309 domain-containing protein n=1 Tax=Acidithiobacillus ferrooxidans TaxID=920 RepID=UPI00214C27AF|nr:DUF2309 domain-containing protein [Acidithiobacillus ferrooxidans]MCR2832160.1 DUF2309 domain-containing protein [Acidithiobacillus ferrooxidans]